MDAEQFHKQLTQLTNEAIRSGSMSFAELIGILEANKLNVHRISCAVEMQEKIKAATNSILPAKNIPRIPPPRPPGT